MRRLAAGMVCLGLVTAACSDTKDKSSTATTSAATASTRPATSSSGPTSPVTRFGDGSFKVNTDVVAGVYEARNITDGCHWQTVDRAGRTIASQTVDVAPRVRATISAAAVGFASDHCGTWHRVG